jgi:hypothetical protein
MMLKDEAASMLLRTAYTYMLVAVQHFSLM